MQASVCVCMFLCFFGVCVCQCVCMCMCVWTLHFFSHFYTFLPPSEIKNFFSNLRELCFSLEMHHKIFLSFKKSILRVKIFYINIRNTKQVDLYTYLLYDSFSCMWFNCLKSTRATMRS